MSRSVRCYLLPSTADAPNNPLPVVHYRGVIPQPSDEAATTAFLTGNGWEKRGAWGHIGTRHFHPNTHECYAICRGRSTLLLGKIQDGTGQEVDVQAGDVIVLPAGTAHSSLESSEDYFYIGIYPENCPRWVNEYGEQRPGDFKAMIKAVEMPVADPVYGREGPLMSLWTRENLARL